MKGSIFNHLKMYYSIKKKKTYCNYKPIQINIEPTNHCNISCSFCSRNKLKRPLGNMDFNLFKKIIDENHKFMKDSEIHLYMFGESLLHPQITDMISYLKKYNLKVQLNTNTTLINGERSRKLIESGLDKLYFSIDSETDKTKEGYETFMRIRGKRKIPQVIAGFIEDTKEDINFYKTADKLYFAPRHNIVDGINSNPKKYACYIPFYLIVINWQGETTTCCRDYNFELITGNIKKQRLEEIWNGKETQNLRKHFFTKNEPPICLKCSELYVPKFRIKNAIKQLIK